MKTLKEDLNCRLDEVERVWIRRPAVIVLYVCVVLPAVLVIGIFGGVWNCLVESWEFIDKCW